MANEPDIQFNFADFLSGDDTELEFSISDFTLTDKVNEQETRYIKPRFLSKPVHIDYENARDLANRIKLAPGEQIHALVRGDFIFGDFIEALVYEKNVVVKNMYLSTLSMSQDNIDSLAGMIEDSRIGNLTLVLSNYFYSHEKHRLVKYALRKLDIDNRLDIIIMRNHTKICLMEVSNIWLILSGSSNLRSSQSVEQFILQENAELYDFYRQWFVDNQGYSIINREVPR